MSEMVVFCVAGSILVYEYQASEKSSAEKAAIAAKKSADEKQRLEDRLTSMDAQLLILADKLQNLEKVQGQQQANGTVSLVTVCTHLSHPICLYGLLLIIVCHFGPTTGRGYTV